MTTNTSILHWSMALGREKKRKEEKKNRQNPISRGDAKRSPLVYSMGGITQMSVSSNHQHMSLSPHAFSLASRTIRKLDEMSGMGDDMRIMNVDYWIHMLGKNGMCDGCDEYHQL
jgi:hypothetical protein